MSLVIHRIAQIGLLAMLLGVLAGAPTGYEPLTWLAWAGLIVYLIDAWVHLPFRGRLFLLICLGLAGVVVATRADPGHAFAAALSRATFVGTLFTALGFLRDAAETSPVVRRCGHFLAKQPPGRRYLALNAGGHIFGLILNFGVIPLLGAMVASSVGSDDSPRGRLRLRRMMTAVHLGFSTILTWSPMTVSLAVVLTALPDTPWSAIAPWCLVSALGYTVLGYLLDRRLKPPPGQRGTFPRPDGSWALVLPIIGLVILVFAAGGAWSTYTGTRLVLGVMTATPVIGTLWLLQQYIASHDGRWGDVAAALGRRLGRHVDRVFPTYRMEVALLSSAAFIGSMVAILLPPGFIEQALAMVPLPPWALAVALGWLVVALGQLGANPVLSVTILTGALPPPATLGVAPEVLAVALTGAWSLTAASSPFSAATLVTGKLGGVSASVVGLRWNGLYTLAGLVLLTLWTATVAAVIG